jgi:hypothetical protein
MASCSDPTNHYDAFFHQFTPNSQTERDPISQPQQQQPASSSIEKTQAMKPAQKLVQYLEASPTPCTLPFKLFEQPE